MIRFMLSFLRNREGNAAIEFAFIAPVLILMLFGIFETGRMYLIRSSLQFAADEAGRFAIVNTTATASAITSAVQDNLVVVNPTDVTVTVQDQTINGIAYKQIVLAYTYSTVLGNLLPMLTGIPLSTQSVVPVFP